MKALHDYVLIYSREMRIMDEVSSLSKPLGLALTGKSCAKIIVLASKTHKYNHLGGNNTAAVQMALSLDRKKYQGHNLLN